VTYLLGSNLSVANCSVCAVKLNSV